jgi:hypothetical protein
MQATHQPVPRHPLHAVEVEMPEPRVPAPGLRHHRRCETYRMHRLKLKLVSMDIYLIIWNRWIIMILYLKLDGRCQGIWNTHVL